MSITQKLKTIIENALGKIGASGIKFTLEHPTDLSHGDFACNVAMVGAKQLGKNPKALAEEIVANIETSNLIEKVEIAGPGFINITLSKNFFVQEIENIQGENFGKISVHEGQKILVEHSSPNLFKPFHVGHMMNNAIGESLTRLMKFSGAEVVPNSFPSDVGLGIAKALWSALKQDHSLVYGDAPLAEKMKFLGECYAAGNRAYEDDSSSIPEIKKINEEIYLQSDTPAFELYQHTKKLNIEYFETTVARLGSEFDAYIFESEAGREGEKIVRENIGEVFKESEGAIVYIPDEETKLPTLVFITSDGHPTYEGKDIGLLSLKFNKYSPDISAVVTDHQQIAHFDVVLDAAGKINSNWKEKSVHIPHGRMAFKGQKMSSRLGGVPLATDILETVLEEVKERSGGRNIDDETMDAIAVGAVKFAILRAKPGQNINFDPETSLSFEGDSGPYLQYTHARITSLLEKGDQVGINPKYQQDQEIVDVERMLYRLPGVVESAISEYAPQYIVTYLLQVAQTFNSYYGSHMIVDVENKEISAHRLALAQATQGVLKKGLWLLGISAPEKM